MIKNRIAALTTNDVAGAVDLANPDCGGCMHRSAASVCKRFPPVFTSSCPVRQDDGSVGMTSGGWSYPPAAQRCGEFKR